MHARWAIRQQAFCLSLFVNNCKGIILSSNWLIVARERTKKVSLYWVEKLSINETVDWLCLKELLQEEGKRKLLQIKLRSCWSIKLLIDSVARTHNRKVMSLDRVEKCLVDNFQWLTVMQGDARRRLKEAPSITSKSC